MLVHLPFNFPRSLLIVCCMSYSLHLWSQDLNQLFGPDRNQQQATPLNINGALNLSNRFYQSTGINARRDALQWRLFAALNLEYGSIAAPFSIAISDANRQFNLPAFSFVGISPTYKWGTLHLGDRSLDFSKYTLNSINFRGVGFELRPSGWYFGGMYGRLRRASAEDFSSQQMLDANFRRVGYGLKAGYAGKGYDYRIIYFGAHDDPNSLPQISDQLILPSSNGILSLQGTHRLGRAFRLEAEIAQSNFNNDVRIDTRLTEGNALSNSLLGLFRPNSSLTKGFAGNAKLHYQFNSLGANIGYERIDVGFRTMGALFFLSDVEYYTVGLNKVFTKQKVSIFSNIGIENTNVSDFRANGTRRLVGSVQGAYTPTDKWSINTTYSNFQNTSKLRTFSDPTLPIDSIILAQTTETFSLALTYNLGSKNTPQTISLTGTYQEANSIQDDIILADRTSEFINSAIMYTYMKPASELRFSAILNYNLTNIGEFRNTVIAPTIGVNKGLLQRKLLLDTRFSYNQIFTGNGTSTSALNAYGGVTYQFSKVSLTTFSINWIQRSSNEVLSGFSELFGQIAYSYRFQREVKRGMKNKDNKVNE